MNRVPASELPGIPHLAEQHAYYDTLRALTRNPRIDQGAARRFAYEASINAREAAQRKQPTKTKGGE